MTTAVQTFERVRSSAERRMKPGIRQVGALADGDFCRQGDVYIRKIPGVPTQAVKVKSPTAQVAPGTTQGSRHVVGDLCGVTIYQLPNANALQGPIVDAPKGFTLEHPEHGHQQFQPGCYAITFQRAFAEELRRVRD